MASWRRRGGWKRGRSELIAELEFQALTAFVPFPLPQRETPRGRFSVSSKELGSSFCCWDFSTSLCAPWTSSAVPSSWLEVRRKATEIWGGGVFSWYLVHVVTTQQAVSSPVVASQPVSGREVTSLLVKSCPHFIEGKTEVWKGAGTGRGSSGQQPGLEPIPSCRPPVSTEPAQEAV